MERERYDGADIVHLLHACSAQFDWHRLLERFGAHWRVLLHYLILFGFVYPQAILHPNLLCRTCWTGCSMKCTIHPRDQICQGTLLSRAQYLRY